MHVLPTLWFRNTWSWGGEAPRPGIARADGADGTVAACASLAELGEWHLQAADSAQLLFCENETNNERLWGSANASPYVKDGIGRFLVEGIAMR